MDHRSAFNTTLDTFKIPAARVAETSGIDTGKISKFRNGKQDLMAATPLDLVNSLPTEARAYFFMLVASPTESSRK